MVTGQGTGFRGSGQGTATSMPFRAGGDWPVMAMMRKSVSLWTTPLSLDLRFAELRNNLARISKVGAN